MDSAEKMDDDSELALVASDEAASPELEMSLMLARLRLPASESDVDDTVQSSSSSTQNVTPWISSLVALSLAQVLETDVGAVNSVRLWNTLTSERQISMEDSGLSARNTLRSVDANVTPLICLMPLDSRFSCTSVVREDTTVGNVVRRLLLRSLQCGNDKSVSRQVNQQQHEASCTHRYCRAVGRLEKLVDALVNEFLVAFSVRSDTGSSRSSRLEMPVLDSDSDCSATSFVNVSAPTELSALPCSNSVCSSPDSGHGVDDDSVEIELALRSR